MHDHSSLLAALKRELMQGDPVFPSSMQLALSLRQTLDRSDSSLPEVVRLLELEPVVAAKLLRLANSVLFNRYGREVCGLEQAVARLGLNAVRSVAMAIALEQLRGLPLLAPYLVQADAAWERCVTVAALARLLAGAATGVQPDEALLCGLVSELGTTYLLFRASSWPAYAPGSPVLQDLLVRHATPVGSQLLQLLGLPQRIVSALGPDALDRGDPAHSLRAVLAEARRLSDLPDPPPTGEPRAEWLLDTRESVQEIRRLLRA